MIRHVYFISDRFKDRRTNGYDLFILQ